jgi:hypothetical protein
MKSNLLLVFVIFTQLVSAASGRATQSGIPGDGSFLGTVRDSANSPLPGVKVTAVNIETNLHSEARMLPSGLFGIPFLPRGTYRIHAELPGFQSVIRVEAIEKGPERVNFWIPAAPNRDATSANGGVITGTVRGFDNVSLPGAAITLRNGATGKAQQVMSDARGNFSVSDLDAGVFEIVADHEGFQTLRMGDIHLSGRFTAQLHLKLKAVAGRAALATR